MSNVKQELDKIKIPDELSERTMLGVKQAKLEQRKGRTGLYKRLSIAAAVCLIALTTFTFTPVLATLQEFYNKIFSSQHIDDTGLKMALDEGVGQTIDQTFYDEKHDIRVTFDNVMTDDKETKLLLTFQSDKTDLENYYIDIFEGKSSVNLIVDGQEIPLNHVGWGSRYYDSKENMIAEALSFDSIKEYEGKELRLEIRNLTYYKDQDTGVLETTWPLSFKLDASAISERETVTVNKEFSFKEMNYLIKEIDFSDTETRVVVTGDDTKQLVDENGEIYEVLSQLEHQFLNARKFEKGTGYTVVPEKSGVFLESAGKRINPIFSKGEIPSGEDEYIMVFEPVPDRKDCILEVGEDIKIPLTE